MKKEADKKVESDSKWNKTLIDFIPFCFKEKEIQKKCYQMLWICFSRKYLGLKNTISIKKTWLKNNWLKWIHFYFG